MQDKKTEAIGIEADYARVLAGLCDLLGCHGDKDKAIQVVERVHSGAQEHELRSEFPWRDTIEALGRLLEYEPEKMADSIGEIAGAMVSPYSTDRVRWAAATSRRASAWPEVAEPGQGIEGVAAALWFEHEYELLGAAVRAIEDEKRNA